MGTFLVNMVGGALCQHFGVQELFLGTGLLCGGWSVILILYHGVHSHAKRQQWFATNATEMNSNAGEGLLVSS